MNHDATAKGSLGMLAMAGTSALSLSLVNQWLQIISLAVGISIGVLTLISMLRKKHHHKKNEKHHINPLR